MRHRWMYYMTGLPGWMRFGFSPGWVGRSPTGLGPCATYLMTGQWPVPSAIPTSTGWPWAGSQPPVPTAADELAALKSNAEWLRSQLDAITSRIEQLEKEP